MPTVIDKQNKGNCCGCTACFAVCPVNAIKMEKDSEGFFYPVIDKNKCIECNKCDEVCAFKHDQSQKEYKGEKLNKPYTYGAKNISLDTRKKSRSGGVFSALTDNILESGGIVYGCIFDRDYMPIHYRADNAEIRNLMRGSKYAQSNMSDVFEQVKHDLDEGKKVVFSGTSCQVAGLNRFLGREYTGLLSVDIVCHGVPSPMVWEDFLKWSQKKHKREIVKADFRNKTDFGWKAHRETIWLDNGKKVDSNYFSKLFYTNCILRPSCYKCPYKDIIHPGNITLADFWGIEEISPEYDDNMGVSLVLINDDKGKNWFENIKSQLDVISVVPEDCVRQEPLKKPYECPGNREDFWKEYERSGFDKIVRKYGGYGFVATVKRHIIRVITQCKVLLRKKIRR